MYAAPGIGLAAIQVGVAKRVVVIDLSKRKTQHSRKSSSIRKSPGHRTRPRPTRKAACRFRTIYEEVERPSESRSSISTSTARRTRLRRRDCSRPASSTRSTTSTACCSSTASSSSSAIASSKFAEAAERQNDEERVEACSRLRHVFIGTPDFAVPTLLEIVGADIDRGGILARQTGRDAASNCGRPGCARTARFGLPVLTPKALRMVPTPQRRSALSTPMRPWSSPSVRPAEPILDMFGSLFRLRMRHCSALARCGADPARHHRRATAKLA